MHPSHATAASRHRHSLYSFSAFTSLNALYSQPSSLLADQICAIGKRWSAGPSINEDWRFPDSNENVEAVIGGGRRARWGAVNPERLQFPPCFSISAFQHLLMNSIFSSSSFLQVCRQQQGHHSFLALAKPLYSTRVNLESGLEPSPLHTLLTSSPTLLPGSLVSDRLVIPRGCLSFSEPLVLPP